VIADIGVFSHPAKAHVAGPGDQTGDHCVVIRILLGVTSQNVLEGLHEVAVPMDEMQHAADVHLCEDIEHGMVDGFMATGIAQGPADLPAASGALEVLVVARDNALIDLGETGFQTLFERS
jgi:hypothetical protein